MYKNIVFDFGGVMVDFDPKEYLGTVSATPMWRSRSAP